MASINGVSSNNMTSSLFNSSKVISGLASGLDTEGMIEGLVQSYQTKINQLNQKATKTEWKQEAYRSIIQKLVGFSSKYTSYTSNTNLTSPSFFSNAVKVLTKGDFKDSVSASGKTGSDIALNAVHQLATAATYRTKSNMATGTTGIIAGESKDLFQEGTVELANLTGSLTLTYGSKNVTISFNDSSDVESMKDIRKSLEEEKGVGNVSNADVLAGLINQKLADQKIVFNSGNSESADKRIKAVAGSDGTISFTELGTAKNGVSITGASGGVEEKLGLDEDTLKDAKEHDKKITSMKMSADLMSTDPDKGLIKSMSGIEYLSEMSKAGARTMNMNLDGTTKQISLPDVRVEKKDGAEDVYYLNGETVDKKDFAAKYTEALQDSVKGAFGDKVSVENVGADGALQLKFKVKNEGSDLVINTDVGNALGIGKTATSYLSTGKTLGDLLGEDGLNGLTQAYERDEKGNFKLDKDNNKILATDSKGQPKYDFVINRKVVGSFSKNSTLSEVLSAINASDAGVKASYSQTTQSFTFTSKETGADSRIEMGEGLAQTLFGTAEEKDVSGSKGFAGAYGMDWLKDGKTANITVEVPGSNIKADLNITTGTTISDIVDKLNNTYQQHYSFSYDKYSGRIEATDLQAGGKVEFAIKDQWGDEIKFDETKAPPAKPYSYTAGQDAKFTVTVNGEQKTMTRSSNSVSIDGLTINMNETFNSKGGNGVYEVADDKKSVTFQTKTDSDKIVDAIKSMAEDYNTMMAEIKKAYNTLPYQKSSGAFAGYEPLTDDDRAGMSESAIERYEEKAKQGILFGDRNLSALYSKMSQVFSFANTRDTDTLKDMGLELTYSTSDGSQALKVDEEKLRAYLDSDPERAAELFTKSDGIMDRMKQQLDYYSKTTGEPKGVLIQQAGSPLSSLSLLNNQWQKEIDNYNTQIEKWQDKLTAQVEKYTRQFSRLEQLINQMNSQSSTLAGLMGG